MKIDYAVADQILSLIKFGWEVFKFSLKFSRHFLMKNEKNWQLSGERKKFQKIFKLFRIFLFVNKF